MKFGTSDHRRFSLFTALLGIIFREEKGFDIVANFSAHKHVRSEKDRYSVQALIENNDIKAKKLMDLLCEFLPRHFFCVSTDKAANPVNIMGASKRIMEDLVMAYNERFNATTARFTLLFASLQVNSMMYPRLLFSDNMEDYRMEETCAKYFQRMIV